MFDQSKGDTVNVLVMKLARNFGIQQPQADTAVGILLNFLSQQTGPNFSQALHNVQGAKTLMDASPSPASSPPEGAGAGLGPEAIQLLPLFDGLATQGITDQAAVRFVSEVLAFLQSEIGTATMESLVINIPGLRPLASGGERYIGTEVLT